MALSDLGGICMKDGCKIVHCMGWFSIARRYMESVVLDLPLGVSLHAGGCRVSASAIGTNLLIFDQTQAVADTKCED